MAGKTSTQDEEELFARPRVRGIELMRNPTSNKGMAFSLKERLLLGIHGLLPPVFLDQSDQVAIIMENFYRWQNDLDRYIYLMSLQDRNEKLFYRVVTEHVETMMPIIYTPTVGLACQKYGVVYRKPRGLYITINDIGHVYDILCNWPIDDVKTIVVTDGERILGLGDLGSYGMGIPVGKLALYTALAGVHPDQCLPIMLDVGTDNETLLKDPMYIGLRQKRERGPAYDQLVEEFMNKVVKRYGENVLVQFEDFGNRNAFRLLEKYRYKFCTFNDDIQGTASVAMAGIFASLKLTGKSLADNRFVFQGAGEASIGIAELIVKAMVVRGLTIEQAVQRIWMVDSRGLIVKNRPSGGVTEHKIKFARDQKPIEKLEDVIKMVKPTAIIGASAIAGAFTETILRMMGKFNDRPVIFALSNPTSKAECTAEQAYTFTEGKAVFASGSPFPPVTYKGKTFYSGQGNNAYIFPGVGLAVTVCDIRSITEDVFLEAAETLSEMVTAKDLAEGRIYPPLSDIRRVSTSIAVKIAEFAYKTGLAYHQPEPGDKAKLIQEHQYKTDYEQFISPIYDWPNNPAKI
ncbi:NADP-dependent malic enzyme-like [Gigantopelta aegis]|uniref:NADP-dependent malic enzyme-like n=1 Tax=Gigantopelta aegis TaxID=1735272 RepID=UPI001B8878D2|nr:NADP-dependent malic enzyme-like [Gigantopelta aegis]